MGLLKLLDPGGLLIDDIQPGLDDPLRLLQIGFELCDLDLKL